MDLEASTDLGSGGGSALFDPTRAGRGRRFFRSIGSAAIAASGVVVPDAGSLCGMRSSPDRSRGMRAAMTRPAVKR